MAGFTSGGWRFIQPIEGMTFYVKMSGVWASFRSGAWETGILRGTSLLIAGDQVVGARAAAIPSPSGGAVIDAEARNAIGQILSALRGHGLINS